MSQRKQHMLVAMIAVCLCGGFLFLLASIGKREDEKKFLKQCKQYEGIWQNDSRTFSLKIYRVTSGHMMCSLYSKKMGREVPFMTAYSVGNGYEFTYSATRLAGTVYRIHAGDDGVGRIYPEEDKIRMEILGIPDKPRALEFEGMLTKTGELPKEETVHLMTYMNTRKKLPRSLQKYCTLFYDEEGKVWRIRAIFNEVNIYRKTDVNGLSLCTFETECEREFGDASESYELSSKRKKQVYEKDEYRYTLIRNEFGAVEEVDCQKKELPGTTRNGDFLMKGDTLFRYVGDYQNFNKISLPSNVKRIASHAFDIGENGIKISNVENHSNVLYIPAGITVEEDAFQNCGPLIIRLAEGWKVVPKRAFAHTVSMQSLKEKKSWVTFFLPQSLERIEEEAFALDNSSKGLNEYWRVLDEDETSVPAIYLSVEQELSNITYIGDNALWGLCLSALPRKATYLGKNLTLLNEGTISIPKGITKLRKDNFFLRGVGDINIKIGKNLQDIESGAFRDNFQDVYYYRISVDKKNPYMYKDKYGWLLSRDNKILYGNETSKFYWLKTNERYTVLRSNPAVIKVNIPEGIEIIRDMLNFNGVKEVSFPKSIKEIQTAWLEDFKK